jgi:hypothetical protein
VRALTADTPIRYCAGVTTVVVVEVGGETGSVTVVVRLTVVVVVVGGGVVTTSSLEQAARQTPTAINGRKRHSVCISVRCFVSAPNDGLLFFGWSRSSITQRLNGHRFETDAPEWFFRQVPECSEFT